MNAIVIRNPDRHPARIVILHDSKLSGHTLKSLGSLHVFYRFSADLLAASCPRVKAEPFL